MENVIIHKEDDEVIKLRKDVASLKGEIKIRNNQIMNIDRIYQDTCEKLKKAEEEIRFLRNIIKKILDSDEVDDE